MEELTHTLMMVLGFMVRMVTGGGTGLKRIKYTKLFLD
jgi:hypothetical protein